MLSSLDHIVEALIMKAFSFIYYFLSDVSDVSVLNHEMTWDIFFFFSFFTFSAQEWDGNLGVQRDSRPRSAFISDSRGSSPKSLSKSLNNDYMIVPPPKPRLDSTNAL